jgi:hypothetical protein
MELGTHVAIQIKPWQTAFGTYIRQGRTGHHIRLNNGTMAWFKEGTLVYPSSQYVERNMVS